MGKFAYRAYLDGIRGLSVGFVLFFHTGVFLFQTGFLGVDVFFVLSGYLITSIIIVEMDSKKSISIVRFYARRARRILPGASITLMIIAVLYKFLVNPLTVFENRRCFFTAATYWSNFCFIADATDYWKKGQNVSPVKHYWSLSIEEQFYVVYPFAMWLILFLFQTFKNRKSGPRTSNKTQRIQGMGEDEPQTLIQIDSPRPSVETSAENHFVIKVTMLSIFSLLSLCSFLYSVHLTLNMSPTRSHMNSFGRVYQLCSGGILAIILSLTSDVRLSSSKRVYFQFSSLILLSSLIFMMFFLAIPYLSSVKPSFCGMLTTVIILCLIFSLEFENKCCLGGNITIRGSPSPTSTTGGGDGQTTTTTVEGSITKRILSFRVFVWLGKWSYSIYLWHFPMIVICDELQVFPTFSNHSSTMLARFFIIVPVSIVLAIISYYLIEKPFMKINMRASKKSPSTTISGSGGLSKKQATVRQRILASMGIVIPVCSAFVIYSILYTFDIPKFIINDSTVDLETFTVEFDDGYLNRSSSSGEEANSQGTTKNIALFGDSQAMQSMKMWEYFEKEFDINFYRYVSPQTPCLVPEWNYKDVRLWDALRELPPSSSVDEDVSVEMDVFFIINQSFNLRCNLYGRCSFMEFSGKGKYTSSTPYRDLWLEAYKRFLEEKVDPLSPKLIVHILAEPSPTLADVNWCLASKSSDEYSLCDSPPKRQMGDSATWEFSKGLIEIVAKERNDIQPNSFKVLNIDELLCPANVCPAIFKGVSTRLDRWHFSKDYWLYRSADFLRLLHENDIFIT